MPEDEDTSDRMNRIILVGLMILAAITIGGTIVSTVVEWEADVTPVSAQFE